MNSELNKYIHVYPPPRLARRRAWWFYSLLATVYSPYSLSATVYSLHSVVYSLQSTVKTVSWGFPARARGRPRPEPHPHSGPLKKAKFQFFELLAASGSFWDRLESILSALKPSPG